MYSGPRRLSVPVLVAHVAWLGGLQAQDHDLAERLFRSGERAFASKSIEEAFETWNQLLKQAPTSPFSAQALLLMARHHVDAQPSGEQAMPLLERLRTEYIGLPVAADALFLRGQILARRARKSVDLREAIAEFNRVVDLFPAHAVVPQAHLALARAHLLQGHQGRALDHSTEVLRWNAGTPEAAQALLLTAEILDLAGDLQGCLRTLQSLRDRFPGRPEAEEAAWRIHLRVRHRLQKPPLASTGPWPAGRQKWLKTPTLLAMGPQGELHLYQEDLDQAFRLEDGALKAVGGPVKDAKALFVDSEGKVGLVSAKVGIVREGRETPVPLGALGNPTGAAQDLWGNLWVSDAKAGSLGLFLADGTSRSLPSPGVSALVALPGGAMVTASDANRTLQILDGNGQPRASWAYGKDLPSGFRSVLALATDPTGHIAALVDGDFEGVVLWSPAGQLLRQATYKQLGISGRFRAIALDRQGGIILADRTNDVLIRLY